MINHRGTETQRLLREEFRLGHYWSEATTLGTIETNESTLKALGMRE